MSMKSFTALLAAVLVISLVLASVASAQVTVKEYLEPQVRVVTPEIKVITPLPKVIVPMYSDVQACRLDQGCKVTPMPDDGNIVATYSPMKPMFSMTLGIVQIHCEEYSEVCGAAMAAAVKSNQATFKIFEKNMRAEVLKQKKK